MRRIIILVVLIFQSLLNAQSDTSTIFLVSGKIIDSESKSPIENATVVFKNGNSNNIVYGGITNHQGMFTVEVSSGYYNATVENISYKIKKLNISEITRNIDIGTIELEIDTKFLEEIEIFAEKKNIKVTPKKIIVNVSKDIASSGGLASDVLNNIPSVTVDDDGNVSLRGQATTVMINGRISSMSKSEALKSLPGASIEKIEILTNPGASFSASYGSIVNIILKKGKNEGLNASITSTAGYKDILGGLLTLNYKTKKYNIYTSTNYGHSKPIRLGEYKTEFFENNLRNSFLNETNETKLKRDNWYGLFGIEFYVSEKTTITPEINYTNLKYKTYSETNTDFFDALNLLQDSNNRFFTNIFDDEILEYSLNFNHNFNEGKTLKAYFSYYNDVENYDHKITNTNVNFKNEDFIEKNKIKYSEVDLQYNHAINENKAFALGYKGEFGTTHFFNTENIENNDIDYIEDVHSVFAEFENQLKKIYYGIGLRAEFSKTYIHYNKLNTKQTLDYNNLFPTIYFEYALGDSKTITISSSKGIMRPTYSYLQPFEEKISETSSFIGNENLLPIYSYTNDITYAYNSNKVTVIPSIMFNIFDNYLTQVTYNTGEQINGVDKLITTYANIGDLKQYALNLTLIYKPNKIVGFTGNILLNQLEQTGVFNTINKANETIEIDFNDSSFGGDFSLLTQIKIPKLFDFQTNIKHFLESEGAVSNRKPYTYASAAISKDLFDKNATISLNVSDIFNSNKTKRNRYDESYIQKTMAENKYQEIKLSFTYRFNQSKKQRKVNFEKKDMRPKY